MSSLYDCGPHNRPTPSLWLGAATSPSRGGRSGKLPSQMSKIKILKSGTFGPPSPPVASPKARTSKSHTWSENALGAPKDVGVSKVIISPSLLLTDMQNFVEDPAESSEWTPTTWGESPPEVSPAQCSPCSLITLSDSMEECIEMSRGEMSPSPGKRVRLNGDPPKLLAAERSPSPWKRKGTRIENHPLLWAEVTIQPLLSKGVNSCVARSSSPALLCEQSAVRLARVAQFEKEEKIQAELDDLLNLLSDAKWIRPQSVLDRTRIALQERIAKVSVVERERDAAVIALDDKTKLIASLTKDAEDDKRKRDRELGAVINSMRVQRQKLEAERDELKRDTDARMLKHSNEKTKLRRELKTAATLLLEVKNKHLAELEDRKKAEEKLAFVEGERDGLKCEIDAANLALAEEKENVVKERDDNKKMRKKVSNTVCKKRKLETDFLRVKERKRKLEKDIRILRKEMAGEKSTLEEAFKGQLAVAESKKMELEAEVKSIREEKNRLETAQGKIQRELEDEKDNALCRICLESTRDTMPLPCLHLHFCFLCLEKCTKLNNTCPTCRTPINGVLGRIRV